MYNFVFEGGFENSYIFQTKKGVIYDIKFRPSPYLLGDENTLYSKDIFEFIIEILYNPIEKSPTLDKKIPETITAIFEDFYTKNSETICIYICDSSDNRQDIRRRKFDDWFYSREILDLLKFDQIIKDSKGIGYPLSVIIKKNNPYLVEVILAFAQISSQNSK